MANPDTFQIAASTKADLQALGIQDFSGLMPADLFSVENIFSLKGLIFYVLGSKKEGDLAGYDKLPGFNNSLRTSIGCGLKKYMEDLLKMQME